MGTRNTTYNNQSSAGAAGSIAYAIQPYAMAKGINNLRETLVMGALITNYSDKARVQGARFADSVRVPKWGTLSANDKTSGTEVTFQQPTMTKADLQIDTHKTVDVLIEDFGGLFTPDAKEGYSVEAGGVLAEAIEADIIALYASAATQLGGITQAADADFVATINYNARNDKWRPNKGRYIVWGPRAERDLLSGNVLQEYVVKGGDQSALRNSQIGNIYRFENYVSNAMPAYTGSPDAEHGIAFQKEAMGIAFLDMSLEGPTPGVEITPIKWADDEGNLVYSMRSLVSYSQSYRGLELSFDTIYGVGVINDSLMYDLVIGDYS